MPAEPRYQVRVIGAPKAVIRDFYHALMRLSWPSTIAAVAVAYFVLNGVFALLYLAVGGIANARLGSIADAFFFSVQTMGTIGYGAMYPVSIAANIVVVGESTVGLVFAALATGLIFAKFSRPSARLVFTRHATIGMMDGVPTLSFRVGNERANRIVEARVRVSIVRTEKTKEGRTFYRILDLKLARDRHQFLSRSWTVIHVIDEASPLYGETRESLASKDMEMNVGVSGTDDIWMQSIYGSHTYAHSDILWGHRHVDILAEVGNDLVLDLRKFHDTEIDPHSAPPG